MATIWPILSNTEAIAINQMWHGHPGRLVLEQTSGASRWQCWAKPGPAGSLAVLLLNAGTSPINATVPFEQLGLPCHTARAEATAAGASCNARDVWAHADLPPMSGAWHVDGLGAHDSRFVVFAPQAAA